MLLVLPRDSVRSLWSFIHLDEHQLWEPLSALLFLLVKDKYSQGFCSSWVRQCLTLMSGQGKLPEAAGEVMTAKRANLLLQGLQSLHPFSTCFQKMSQGL